MKVIGTSMQKFTHNIINNKVSATKTFLYCNTCGKNIHENLILCYIFIDYFCSEKCHVQKHKIHLENIDDVD
jgi:hypothetical protein